MIVFIVSGCRPILLKMAGIHEPRQMTTDDMNHWSKKMGIDTFPVFSLDTSFIEFVKENYKPEDLRHFIQPIVLTFYDSSSKLVSVSTNCMYPGFPTLKWSTNNSFDTFPARQSVYLEPASDQELGLEELKKFLKPLNSKSVHLEFSGIEGEVLVAFVGPTLQKQVKNLIEIIDSKYSDTKVEVVYVINEDVQYCLDNSL